MNPQALNSYSYAHNNPVTYSDPNGKALPLIIGAWALAEIGLSAYDVYSTGQTLFNPNASIGEKITTGGLTIAGLALPGGGYGSIGKEVMQVYKQTNATGRVLMEGVENQKVLNLIKDNYRATKDALIGSGSAVDAMLHTLRTGELVKGTDHVDKVRQNVNRINNILKDQSLKLNSSESKAVNTILRDSQNALNKLKNKN